ncbi:MAG TPA: glycosyltransferase family 4 protein [Anaerolineales bacterium]|nr:glycosyltransferase family 4 protein [Anaerolineales bacterium]
MSISALPYAASGPESHLSVDIVYLCQYFVPEPAAPSARVAELSRAWVQAGHNVTVLTGMPNHPTGVVPEKYRRRLLARERLHGVTVLRNWLYATPNKGFAKKTLSHLSFMLSAVLLGLPRLGRADVLIVSSPTFFSVFSGLLISRLRRIPFVFEVRDLWPAVFVDLDVLTNPLLIKFLEYWEMFLYRQAAQVVTVTESFRHVLIERGLPGRKVVTMSNGANVDFFQPGERDNAVRSEHGLTDCFVVSYFGAHGISHGVEIVLRAADILRARNDIVFLLAGEGAMKKRLLALKERMALENVLMLPAQPMERMPDFYRASDVCMVPLRNVPLFETFVPSKMFEVMACGVPIIGALRGEAREILKRSGAARLVAPENAQELAQAIEWMQANPRERSQMGAAGRNFVCEHFDRGTLAGQYAELLARIAK